MLHVAALSRQWTSRFFGDSRGPLQKPDALPPARDAHALRVFVSRPWQKKLAGLRRDWTGETHCARKKYLLKMEITTRNFSHVKIFALQLLLRNALGPSKLGLEVHKHMLCILCTAHLGFNFRILATCVAIDNVLLSP